MLVKKDETAVLALSAVCREIEHFVKFVSLCVIMKFYQTKTFQQSASLNFIKTRNCYSNWNCERNFKGCGFNQREKKIVWVCRMLDFFYRRMGIFRMPNKQFEIVLVTTKSYGGSPLGPRPFFLGQALRSTNLKRIQSFVFLYLVSSFCFLIKAQLILEMIYALCFSKLQLIPLMKDGLQFIDSLYHLYA